MAPATRRMSQSNRSWAIEYLRRNEFLDGDRGTGGRVFASAGCWVVPSLSNTRAFPSPPSSQLLQHCCKLVWIDTVGLHHCLDDRIRQDVCECWFGLTIIHHSFPRWSRTGVGECLNADEVSGLKPTCSPS